MSNTARLGDRIQNDAVPRAIVHKKILDAAKAHPETSIEGLAEQTDGATIELVERVLDKYGDPANGAEASDSEADGVTDHQFGNKQTTNGDKPSEPTMNTEEQNATTGGEPAQDSSNTQLNNVDHRPQSTAGSSDRTDEASAAGSTTASSVGDTVRTETEDETENQSGFEDKLPGSNSGESSAGTQSGDDSSRSVEDVQVVNPGTLTEKRLEVLQAIRDRPHATQAELAEQLDVSRATISQRVNAIEGFEWGDRREYVDAVFDGFEPRSDGNGSPEPFEEIATRIDTLAERIERIEQKIDEQADTRPSAFDDPELAATVVRACIDSETVTEQQEERIIVEMIEAGRY